MRFWDTIQGLPDRTLKSDPNWGSLHFTPFLPLGLLFMCIPIKGLGSDPKSLDTFAAGAELFLPELSCLGWLLIFSQALQAYSTS